MPLQRTTRILYNALMKNTDSLPIMSFETQQDWEKWLAEHHAETVGIWLKLAKKETGIPFHKASFRLYMPGSSTFGAYTSLSSPFGVISPTVKVSDKYPCLARPESAVKMVVSACLNCSISLPPHSMPISGPASVVFGV